MAECRMVRRVFGCSSVAIPRQLPREVKMSAAGGTSMLIYVSWLLNGTAYIIGEIQACTSFDQQLGYLLLSVQSSFVQGS